MNIFSFKNIAVAIVTLCCIGLYETEKDVKYYDFEAPYVAQCLYDGGKWVRDGKDSYCD